MSLSAGPAWCNGAAGMFGYHHVPLFVGHHPITRPVIAPTLLHGRSPARGRTSVGDVSKHPWVLQESIAPAFGGAGRAAKKVQRGMAMQAGRDEEGGKKGSGALRSANITLMRCGRYYCYCCSRSREGAGLREMCRLGSLA